MPLTTCRKDGNPGYKWGEDGHCYSYEPSSPEARERAIAHAKKQGQAIESHKHDRDD